jgi:acetyl/propionyl-CoA carboxylase alpha subunit
VKRSIDTVLVANRGEVARRVFRTCRLMGLGTVAVYADPDAASPHVEEADVAAPLGGEVVADTYLSIPKLLDAAKRTGATAVHPGYGFLAENAEFAEACVMAGLTWIGPSAKAIRSMASKVEAKRLAASHGVPVLPSAELDGDDRAAWRDAAERVGYPVLVKASAGGGGKGMRRVDDPGDLADAIQAGRREAMASFGDATVFLERFLDGPRHVEVQLIGDDHGTLLHLLDRDCSIQRRNQKLIEEAPAPWLSDAVRLGLHEGALSLARAIGYTNAGTVEFLVAGDDVSFLEMNTRLQVEHAVTEAVCGLDIVRLQLDVAAGRPLGLTQDDIRANGHAVEARVNAEDPAHGFLPSIGPVFCFDDSAGSGLRVDAGVRAGSAVTSHYDPMLAKMIAHAPTREAACQLLASGLRRFRIHGVTTTRDAIVATLESAAFRRGPIDTAFLDRHREVLEPAAPADVRTAHVVAAAAVIRRDTAAGELLPRVAPPGWRNMPVAPARYEFHAGPDTIVVELDHHGPVSVDGRRIDGHATAADDGTVVVDLDGLRRRVSVHRHGDRIWMNDARWQTELVEVERYVEGSLTVGAGGPMAPLPGSVVSVEVEVGDDVAIGDVLVVIEAMKMEHRIVADVAGIVAELTVAVGDRVDAHQVVARITPSPDTA